MLAVSSVSPGWLSLLGSPSCPRQADALRHCIRLPFIVHCSFVRLGSLSCSFAPFLNLLPSLFLVFVFLLLPPSVYTFFFFLVFVCLAFVSFTERWLLMALQWLWFLFWSQLCELEANFIGFCFHNKQHNKGAPYTVGATMRYSGAQRYTVGRTVALSVSAVGRNFVAKAFTWFLYAWNRKLKSFISIAKGKTLYKKK